jgi:micrococcal nuclease
LRPFALSSLIAAALTFNVAHAQVSSTTGAGVVRVIDGDTVDVRFDNGTRERLRLIGMDSPEVVDARKPVLI